MTLATLISRLKDVSRARPELRDRPVKCRVSGTAGVPHPVDGLYLSSDEWNLIVEGKDGDRFWATLPEKKEGET
jgi:hypothetical protein